MNKKLKSLFIVIIFFALLCSGTIIFTSIINEKNKTENYENIDIDKYTEMHVIKVNYKEASYIINNKTSVFIIYNSLDEKERFTYEKYIEVAKNAAVPYIYVLDIKNDGYLYTIENNELKIEKEATNEYKEFAKNMSKNGISIEISINDKASGIYKINAPTLFITKENIGVVGGVSEVLENNDKLQEKMTNSANFLFGGKVKSAYYQKIDLNVCKESC